MIKVHIIPIGPPFERLIKLWLQRLFLWAINKALISERFLIICFARLNGITLFTLLDNWKEAYVMEAVSKCNGFYKNWSKKCQIIAFFQELVLSFTLVDRLHKQLRLSSAYFPKDTVPEREPKAILFQFNVPSNSSTEIWFTVDGQEPIKGFVNRIR